MDRIAPEPAASVSLDGILARNRPKSSWARLLEFPPGFYRKVIAEVIATYLLVFVTCGAAAISENDGILLPKLGASIAGGLIVTVMIYAVGHISGAHMNPAVTFAFASVLGFPWKQVPCYVAAQLMGAISAGFTLRLLLNPIKRLGTTSPSGSPFQALAMEIVVTFSMMFVTSAVATDTNAVMTVITTYRKLISMICGADGMNSQVGELAGMAVGSAVCITSILAGPISGGSMNPARTIGPALASLYFKDLWVYIIGPVIGTLLGACSYSIIRGSDIRPANKLVSPSLSVKLRRRLRRNNEIGADFDDNLESK